MPPTPGSLWIEGKQLCYIDEDGNKQCGDLAKTGNLLRDRGVPGQVDSQSVSLSGGETKSITLTWSDTEDWYGKWTAIVKSEDDSDFQHVEVEQN